MVVFTPVKGTSFAMNTRFSQPSMQLQQGISATVKWFNASKGFGFVAPQDGSSDAFLHISVLQQSGLQGIDEGVEIVCDLEEGPKGPQVSRVESVSAGANPMNDSSTIIGVVKFFSAEKGFGFVTPDDGGKDVFVGIGSLSRSGLADLEAGQRVRLDTRMGSKGPMAEGVELI